MAATNRWSMRVEHGSVIGLPDKNADAPTKPQDSAKKDAKDDTAGTDTKDWVTERQQKPDPMFRKDSIKEECRKFDENFTDKKTTTEKA